MDPRKTLFDAPEDTFVESGNIPKVVDLLNEVGADPGKIKKVEILFGCDGNIRPELIQVLDYTYDTYKVYRISSQSIKKILKDKQIGTGRSTSFRLFFEFLDKQTKAIGRTDAAVEEVKNILYQLTPECADLAIKILKRDLRVKIGPKLINQAFTDLLRIHEVQKCLRLAKGECELPPGAYLASIKYNGTRLTAFPFMGKYTLFTSNGKIRENPHVTDELDRLFGHTDLIFDAESFDTDWNTSMAISAKDNSKKKGQVFKIFDAVTWEEWHQDPDVDRRDNFKRYVDLCNLFIETQAKTKIPQNIQLLEQVLFMLPEEDAEYNEMYAKALLDGFEGLVLKPKHGLYDCKRTWYKRKPDDTEDCEIIGFNESEKNPGTLGSVRILLPSGIEQNCAGMTKNQREKFWKDRDNMLHHVYEVKFDEYTKDGKLLFPRIGKFRFDKTDML